MRYDSTQMIPSQHIGNPQQFHSTSLTTNKWLLIMTSLNTTYHITQVTHRSSLYRTMLSWFTGNFANVMCVYDDKNAKAPADIFFTQSNSDSGMLQHNSLGEKRTWPRELAGRDCAFLFQVTVLCQRIWGRCLYNRVFLVRRTEFMHIFHVGRLLLVDMDWIGLCVYLIQQAWNETCCKKSVCPRILV